MNLALDRITFLLSETASDKPCFPPTLLFEEGWMLRLVLDWFSSNRTEDHVLAFDKTARWFSEARLASTFLPRFRGDKHAEGYTHADGVLGHFSISPSGHAFLSVSPDATLLKVVEAKMFSKLSRGTTHAPRYNQAARNVACIAEILRRANRKPSELRSLGFYVLAPKEQIEDGVFRRELESESIKEIVGERVERYDKPKTEWFEDWFLPMLEHIQIGCISWEDIITYIQAVDAEFGQALSGFYVQCLKHNRPRAKRKSA